MELDESRHGVADDFGDLHAEVLGSATQNVGVDAGCRAYETERLTLIVVLGDIAAEECHESVVDEVVDIVVVEMLAQEEGVLG